MHKPFPFLAIRAGKCRATAAMVVLASCLLAVSGCVSSPSRTADTQAGSGQSHATQAAGRSGNRAGTDRLAGLRKFTDAVMIDVARGHLDAAYGKIASHAVIPRDRLQASEHKTVEIRSQKQFAQNFGRLMAVDFAGYQHRGKDGVRINYVERRQKRPLVWSFDWKPGTGGWVIDGVSWTPNPQQLIAGTPASKNAAANLVKITDAVMKNVAAGKLQAAYALIVKYSLVPRKDVDAAYQHTVAQRRGARFEQQTGKLRQVQRVAQREVAGDIARVDYVERHDKQPVAWGFTGYKTAVGWAILGFSWRVVQPPATDKTGPHA